MKKLAALVALLAIAALAAFTPTKPRAKLVGFGASFAIAPDSTVTATASVAMTGTLLAGDSIRYKFMKDGVVLLNKQSVLLTMGATMPAPAYGASSSYTVSAQVTRSSVNAGVVVVSAPWVYTRPAAPLPVIDSVRISPASVTLTPGQTATVTVRVFQS